MFIAAFGVKGTKQFPLPWELSNINKLGRGKEHWPSAKGFICSGRCSSVEPLWTLRLDSFL